MQHRVCRNIVVIFALLLAVEFFAFVSSANANVMQLARVAHTFDNDTSVLPVKNLLLIVETDTSISLSSNENDAWMSAVEHGILDIVLIAPSSHSELTPILAASVKFLPCDDCSDVFKAALYYSTHNSFTEYRNVILISDTVQRESLKDILSLFALQDCYRLDVITPAIQSELIPRALRPSGHARLLHLVRWFAPYMFSIQGLILQHWVESYSHAHHIDATENTQSSMHLSLMRHLTNATLGLSDDHVVQLVSSAQGMDDASEAWSVDIEYDRIMTKKPTMDHEPFPCVDMSRRDEPHDLILVVGLPKAGTTSLRRYLQDGGGLRVDHFNGNNGDSHVGEVMHKNWKLKRPPFEGLGYIDVHAQMDFAGKNEAKCFFPQCEMLDYIHSFHPSATLILNLRDPAKWCQSVLNWKSLNKRLKTCHITGLPVGIGETCDELIPWWHSHVAYIRDFVKQHPSHKLVEVTIDQPDAGETLEAQLGYSREYWGQYNHNNKNKEK